MRGGRENGAIGVGARVKVFNRCQFYFETDSKYGVIEMDETHPLMECSLHKVIFFFFSLGIQKIPCNKTNTK